MSQKREGVIGLYAAVWIVVVIFTWMFIGVGYQNCTEAGGQYVRGVVWFQCINEEGDR